jgi:uncharacterized membrane protein (DUF2068 family)
MSDRFRPIPGTQKPRRVVPRFHWELLVCGVSGHELVGTDAAELREEDAVFARDERDMRWYRCLRCDSWVPLAPPTEPARRVPPAPAEIEVPLRGKALRDKVVLRLIAIDRALHFVALAAFAVLVLVFASHESQLRRIFFRVLGDLEGGSGHGSHGFVHTIQRLVTIQSGTLHVVAAVAAAYALLEGAEAVGLWIGARWAEYLTFVATAALLPLEVYELANRVSPFKVVAIVVNLAIVVYLLLAKRLFGLRGGAEADRRERERDLGWDALRATAPS